MSTTKQNMDLTAEELVARLGGEELMAMATLARGGPDFVPLALAGLPRGMQAWAEAYGLITRAGAELALTGRGREVAAVAASKVPEPYADVTLDDLLAQTREAVERLSVHSSAKIAPPQRDQLVATTPVARRARGLGRQIGQRVALALGRRESPFDEQTAGDDSRADQRNAAASSRYAQH